MVNKINNSGAPSRIGILFSSIINQIKDEPSCLFLCIKIFYQPDAITLEMALRWIYILHLKPIYDQVERLPLRKVSDLSDLWANIGGVR